jgi:hypothetical protein
MPITRTDLQVAVTKTAPFSGAWVDVSAITGDFTVLLRVKNIDTGSSVRFLFEESPDGSAVVATGLGFAFTNAENSEVINPSLPIEGIAACSFRRRDFGAFTKIGTAGGKLRVRLDQIDSGSVTYEAAILH